MKWVSTIISKMKPHGFPHALGVIETDADIARAGAATPLLPIRNCFFSQLQLPISSLYAEIGENRILKLHIVGL